MDEESENIDPILRVVKQHAYQISDLMPGIPTMNLTPEAVALILEVVKQYAEQISNSKALLEKANVKLSYFFSHNPGIEIYVKVGDLEGDIDIYFGSGTANIYVVDFSDGEIRYEWHGIIGDLTQFLGVLREVFAVLVSKILQDEEGHSHD